MHQAMPAVTVAECESSIMMLIRFASWISNGADIDAILAHITSLLLGVTLCIDTNMSSDIVI